MPYTCTILRKSLNHFQSPHVTVYKMQTHNENTPMQYTAIFHGCKNDNFQMKNCDVFLFLLKT